MCDSLSLLKKIIVNDRPPPPQITVINDVCLPSSSRPTSVEKERADDDDERIREEGKDHNYGVVDESVRMGRRIRDEPFHKNYRQDRESKKGFDEDRRDGLLKRFGRRSYDRREQKRRPSLGDEPFRKSPNVREDREFKKATGQRFDEERRYDRRDDEMNRFGGRSYDSYHHREQKRAYEERHYERQGGNRIEEKRFRREDHHFKDQNKLDRRDYYHERDCESREYASYERDRRDYYHERDCDSQEYASYERRYEERPYYDNRNDYRKEEINGQRRRRSPSWHPKDYPCDEGSYRPKKRIKK